jgi:hypothetical protein
MVKVADVDGIVVVVVVLERERRTMDAHMS